MAVTTTGVRIVTDDGLAEAMIVSFPTTARLAVGQIPWEALERQASRLDLPSLEGLSLMDAVEILVSFAANFALVEHYRGAKEDVPWLDNPHELDKLAAHWDVPQPHSVLELGDLIEKSKVFGVENSPPELTPGSAFTSATSSVTGGAVYVIHQNVLVALFVVGTNVFLVSIASRVAPAVGDWVNSWIAALPRPSRDEHESVEEGEE